MTLPTRRAPFRRFATACGVAACVVASCGGANSETSSPNVVRRTEANPPTGPDGFELVFRDEFDGNDGDERSDVEGLRAEWSTCFWWQVDGGCTIASNGEQQWYRPEAVDVADGVVTITADTSPERTTDGSTLPVRSGMISTGHRDNDVDEPGFAFTYGYVEARIRLPDGDGTWPAVWLLSADRSSLPEIDLMEWYGSRPELVTSHVHQRIDDDRASERLDLELDNLAGEWHTVAADWQEEHVEFFFDGVSMGQIDDAELIPSTPMYVIVNLAMGGRAGDIDFGALPQTLEIDWVRVWQ